MFPPQTSLMPVTVAIARFVEAYGFVSVFPYWYLAEPLRFLTGPLIPLILTYLHKLLPSTSLFDLTYLLMFISFIAAAFGWGQLAERLSGYRLVKIAAIVTFMVLPFKWVYSLSLADPTVIIAKNCLPFFLILLDKYFTQKSHFGFIAGVITLSLILLINISILPTFLIGAIALTLAHAYLEKSISQDWFKRIFYFAWQSLLVILPALILVTFWYTPMFWVTLLANPSYGGANSWQIVMKLVSEIKILLPILLAIIVVFTANLVKNRFQIFTMVWLISFGFLISLRFLFDKNFWYDLETWFFEIEIGLAYLMAALAADLAEIHNDLQIKSQIRVIAWFFIILLIAFLPFSFTSSVYNKLYQPLLVRDSPPATINSLDVLNTLVASQFKRVFLSGSTVFWANSLYDLYQVRGGKDEAAVNPFWDMASFQLREGDSPELAAAWLKAIGVSYILVHTEQTKEFYRDFHNFTKWTEVGKSVWEGEGDIIYELQDNAIAYEVDEQLLALVKKPKDGKDLEALESYIKVFTKPLEIKKEPGKIVINAEGAKSTLLLLTYLPSYWATNEKGEMLKTSRDPYGNTLIHSQNAQQVWLSF